MKKIYNRIEWLLILLLILFTPTDWQDDERGSPPPSWELQEEEVEQESIIEDGQGNRFIFREKAKRKKSQHKARDKPSDTLQTDCRTVKIATIITVSKILVRLARLLVSRIKQKYMLRHRD